MLLITETEEYEADQTMKTRCSAVTSPSFLLLNMENIISSSSSPREQNVALGIKLFDYSVSYRLANLTLSHLAPWTHQWYVCLHIRARAACVGVHILIRRLVFVHAVVLWVTSPAGDFWRKTKDISFLLFLTLLPLSSYQLRFCFSFCFEHHPAQRCWAACHTRPVAV